ncbi:MAG: acyltransferase [Yoonia sp.]|uniref:acyltransferase family protein n=1 Tax=Yoonia sp. TaxID=2212373 RepID=UPI00273D753B|nr:acyltransferase [Yoonia sp.]MDP5086825.1 acyltransferase [Yoonia sp.]
MTTPSKDGLIPSLDGLRAVSILLVFIGHLGLNIPIPGGFGVTVFFFLSGFLITTLLLREYASYQTISLKRFYLRRVLRLAPPLLLTLFGAALLVWAGYAQGTLDPLTMLSQVFFFYNYFSLYGPVEPVVEGLGILWSLSVEEHFYLIWPVLFLLLMWGRIGLHHLVGLIVLSLIWRYVHVLGFGDDEWTVYISTDTRFDSLLFGCLLALMHDRKLTLPRAFQNPVAMYAILAMAVGVILFTFVYREDVFRSTLRYSLQGLALIPIFHFAVTRPEALVFQPLNWGFVRRIGVWSYTVYLCHFVIIEALRNNGVAADNIALFFVLAFALSCFWADLVFRIGEKPFHPLRKRLSGPPQAL